MQTPNRIRTRGKELSLSFTSHELMARKSADSDCGCKLGRVGAIWNLESTISRLETARRDRDASLRELERKFNRAVLGAALEAEGYAPLDGEVDNLYRLLSEDDVTGGMRIQARNRLKDRGVDVDAVQADFVSYQTINRHLKECRGVTGPSGGPVLSVDRAQNRLFALRSRTVAVTRQTIDQLDRVGAIHVGEFDVNIDVGVTCTQCGSQADLDELFAEWRCRC